MNVVFFVPLLLIAFWETNLDPTKNKYIGHWFSTSSDGEIESSVNEDPDVEEPDGCKIAKVPFDDIVKSFPNALIVSCSHLVVIIKHQ